MLASPIAVKPANELDEFHWIVLDAPPGVPPDPPAAEIVIVPAVGVTVTLVPAAIVLYSRPVAPVFTPRIWEAVPIVVRLVPPLVVGTVGKRAAFSVPEP